MSTDCSIWTKHSLSLGQSGRTSMDILCHDASNNLCPSNKLEIPAFPLQGRSFKNGVRFSVQTTSPGSVPCNRYNPSDIGWSPVGSNETTGRVVRVESMKFSDAQKRPDKDCVKVIHLADALQTVSNSSSLYRSLVRWCQPTLHCSRHQSMPIALPQSRLL